MGGGEERVLLQASKGRCGRQHGVLWQTAAGKARTRQGGWWREGLRV
jgi:hypothetical protein